ncbi:MAG: 30S ribosomal protein S16 [Planctomycetes bacterium]|nr:30S ribosomal protein S16 [Planctomycetota bacterium]|tara:strand:+ start:115 stop:435 length:321 start_codon:yes stop_codon:yes gene_type:complete
MAVAIRLKRFGRRHRPFYRIEAIEKRNARGGRSLETVGWYDPLVDDAQKRVKLHVDRIQHWIDRGARPSETVISFLRKSEVKWGNGKKSRRSQQRTNKKNQGGPAA